MLRWMLGLRGKDWWNVLRITSKGGYPTKPKQVRENEKHFY